MAGSLLKLQIEVIPKNRFKIDKFNNILDQKLLFSKIASGWLKSIILKEFLEKRLPSLFVEFLAWAT